MSRRQDPEREDALLRQVERLSAEARQPRDPEEPNAMLLALTLRDQLVQSIGELRKHCTALAGEMSAGRLRQIATAAYGAPLTNRRTTSR